MATVTCMYKYLLTPMDCVTLPHTKSPIPHCTPSEIIMQQVLQAIFKAHCYTDCHLSFISTYIHGKAKLRVVDLLSAYDTSKFATNIQEIEWMELQP